LSFGKKHLNDPTIEAYSALPKNPGPQVGKHLKWERDAIIQEIASLKTN
jgi:hypothetical protein